MAVTIFMNKFMDNLEWSYIKTTSDIAITSFYLIDDKLVLGTSTLKDKIFGITKKTGPIKCGLSG